MEFFESIRHYWLPEAASSFSLNVDNVFYGYMFFSWMVLTGIGYFMIRFGFLYKRKHPQQKASAQITHNFKLEVAWTLIPAIVFFVLFTWGYVDYIDEVVIPENSMEVKVNAEQWSWEFVYPNGAKENTLVVPINQPIRLLMTSQKVIHSFFVPAFRIKKDVLPNMYTTLWFEATKKGEYHVFCTEFCGTSHSKMITKVRVVDYPEFKEWVDSKTTLGLTPEQLGEKIYKQKCFACHNLDGTATIGPSWKGLFGSKSKTNTGNVLVDENYIRESIEEPAKKVVVGFAPTMPTYQGILSDVEIEGLITFIKTLK